MADGIIEVELSVNQGSFNRSLADAEMAGKAFADRVSAEFAKIAPILAKIEQNTAKFAQTVGGAAKTATTAVASTATAAASAVEKASTATKTKVQRDLLDIGQSARLATESLRSQANVAASNIREGMQGRQASALVNSLQQQERAFQSTAAAARIYTTETGAEFLLVGRDAQVAEKAIRNMDEATRAAAARSAAAAAAMQTSSARTQSLRGNENLFRQLQMYGRGARQVENDIQNMRYQINDVVTGLAMGSSPFVVLSQQAGQFSQLLQGTNIKTGFGLIAAAARSMINPINIGIAGITLATYLASKYFDDTEKEGAEATRIINAHGAAIAALKDAYGDAAKGLEEYREKLPKILADTLASDSLKELRDAISEGGSEIVEDLTDQMLMLKVAAEEGGAALSLDGVGDTAGIQAIEDAVRAFNESVRSGNPDLRTLQQTLIDISENENFSDAVRQNAREAWEASKALNEFDSKARELKESLRAVSLELRLIEQRAKEFGNVLEELRNIAPFELDEAALARQKYLIGMQMATSVGAMHALEAEYLATMERIEAKALPRPVPNPTRDLTSDLIPGVDPEKAKKAAKETVSAYDQTIIAGRRKIAELAMERDAFGMTEEAAERLRFEFDLLSRASKDGPLTPEQVAVIKQMAGEMSDLSVQIRAAEEAQKKLKQAQEDAIAIMDDFRDTTRDLIQGFADDLIAGADAGEALLNVLSKIGAKLFQIGLDGLIEDMLGAQGTAGTGPLGQLANALAGNKTAANDNKVTTADVTKYIQLAGGGSTGTANTSTLLSALAEGRSTSSITGMDSDFASKLSTMLAKAPPDVRSAITINSGFRSREQQQKLWDDALAKYGDPEIADNWVARPGGSLHEAGMAADLGFGNEAAKTWAHANAGEYGLKFPLANEDWHIEDARTRIADLGTTAQQAQTNISAMASATTEVPPALSTFTDGLDDATSEATATLTKPITIDTAEIETEGGEGMFGGLFGSLFSGLQSIFSKIFSSFSSFLGPLFSLFGFESGGFTGSGSNKKIAGVVHKNEFVMDAAATARIGISNLTRMQKGYSDGGFVGATPANSNTPNRQPVVNVRNINVLDPKLVGDYLATTDGERAIVNVMRRTGRA